MIYAYEACCLTPKGTDRYCSLATYEANPKHHCEACGRELKQLITRPHVFAKSFDAFKSPVDGSIISTHRELAEHNKRNNVVNIHDGYDEAGVQSMTKRDHTVAPEGIQEDMQQAIKMLEQGYSPTPQTEEVP